VLILNTLACDPQMAEDFTAPRARGAAERPLLRDGNTAGQNEFTVAGEPMPLSWKQTPLSPRDGADMAFWGRIARTVEIKKAANNPPHRRIIPHSYLVSSLTKEL